MHRRLGLSAALLTAVLLPALLLPAGANAKHSGSAVTIITKQNEKCNADVKPLDYASMACTTLKAPKYGIPGKMYIEKFVFKAKARLTNVVICFSPPNYGTGKPACVHPRKFMYSVMNKGTIVPMTVSTMVPLDVAPGQYKTENWSTMKPPGSTFRTAYWPTQRSFVRVAAAPAAPAAAS